MELPDETRELIRRARTVHGIPPEHYQIAERSIAALLDRRAAETPDKPFLIFYDDTGNTREEFTFARFNRRVNQVANYLCVELGVRRGARVATIAYNHPDTAIVYFATDAYGELPEPPVVILPNPITVSGPAMGLTVDLQVAQSGSFIGFHRIKCRTASLQLSNYGPFRSQRLDLRPVPASPPN